MKLDTKTTAGRLLAQLLARLLARLLVPLLLPLFVPVTALLLTACGGGQDKPTPDAGLAALPVASAGSTRAVAVGSTVTLDGSASRDPGGSALSYAWTLLSRPSGSAASLAAASSASPSFVADRPGSYGLTLVVNNGSSSSAAANVTITATPTNAAPSARTGGNQSVLVSSTVRLDGSTSTDPDGDALSYRWVLILKPAGSVASLSSDTSPQATFVADLAGSYSASLVVNDGSNSSLTSLVNIVAATGNVAPVARAGSAQNKALGSSVTLDGEASSDANLDALSYRWTLSERPVGSTAVLSSTSARTTTFLPDGVGSYVATLVVNDGALDSAPSTVAVTVRSVNVPPQADAGPAQRVAIGSRVLLDGRLSAAANGEALTYLWSLTSRPAGSAAALTDRMSVQAAFLADLEGLYVASLVVNDGRLDSAGSTVTVTATLIIPALPVGAGTWAQARGGTAFHAIHAVTGASVEQPNACAIFSAADLMPDGVVLATTAGSSQLQQVDLPSGRCKDHFTVAEPMLAVAVAADGVVHLISETLSQGARQLYRYSASGGFLSKLPIRGAAGSSGVADLGSPQAMDFGPDGRLWMSQGGSLWQVDPSTGVGLLSATGLASSGDFDIDAAGHLRTIDQGRLNLYAVGSWELLGSVALQRDVFAASALVHR